VRSETVEWLWFPMLLPAFMLIYSLIILIVKWVVIGRYRATQIDIPSWNYLRWWFVDRAMDLWEFLIGRYLMDTWCVWLFYSAMGATIHHLAKLNGPIREFDLVTIHAHADIEYQIRCRKFGPWADQHKQGPTIRFRPIVVGKKCKINSLLSPGVSVGDESHVEKFAVVAEGAQVPSNVIAGGNPAVNHGENMQKEEDDCEKPVFGLYVLEIVKLVWLLMELYIFFGLFFVPNIAWSAVISTTNCRYGDLLHWFAVVMTQSVMSIVVSIALKWILIGRRDPAEKETMWSRGVDWICDFHFTSSIMILYTLNNSKAWNIVLMLHGLDVDFATGVIGVLCYPPSKVDSIKLRKSFVSIFLDIGREEGKGKTEIIESSIGMSAAIDPGVKVVRSTVRPFVHVKEDLHDDRTFDPAPYPLWKWVARDIFYLIEMVSVPWTFIPLYELMMAFPTGASLGIQVLGVAFAILLQCVVWTCYLRLLQFVAYSLPDTSARTPLLHTLSSYEWTVQTYGLWCLLFGTPFFGKVLQVFGSTVEGRLLFFGEVVQDIPLLSFADKTIVDNSIVTGHHQVYSVMTLRSTSVGGVVHAGSRLFGGACVESNQEHGPLKFSASTDQDAKQHGGPKTVKDIISPLDETVEISHSNGSRNGDANVV